MNKITIDMSEINNTSECELTIIKPNGVIIQFPRVCVGDIRYNVDKHKEYCCLDQNRAVLYQYETKLIDEINGKFNFVPLVDDDGVQYREIREVKA